MTSPAPTRISPWPHRTAWLLACATFPLIWVGGLVTTTDAGMAFRDWLTSDGHFMLFYPWLSSAGEKFVEHGHRLLGATAGFLTLTLVAVVWRCESRAWVRKFSLIILAGVILQGVLGGMRVVFDQRTIALVHGCTGPVFFMLAVAMVVFTSRWWREVEPAIPTDSHRRLFRLAIVCTALALAQLVVGAVVRHSPHLTASYASALFHAAVYFHILLALLIVGHVALLTWRCSRTRIQVAASLQLAGLVALQIVLGLGTWVHRYGVPGWVTSLVGDTNLVNREADLLQNAIVTSHVAVGSLILAVSLVIVLRIARQFNFAAPLCLIATSNLAEAAR